MSAPIGRHEQCDACLTRRCHSLNTSMDPPLCCPLVPCPNLGCSFELHACKVEDHAHHVCLFQRVPCVNECNGCGFELRRGDMHLHLQTCPASVVRCMAEWNRWPTLAPADTGLGSVDDADHFPTGNAAHAREDAVILSSSSASSYLDVALRARDQKILDESRKIPLRLKSALRGLINRKHPAAPVEIPLMWTSSITDNSQTAGEIPSIAPAILPDIVGSNENHHHYHQLSFIALNRLHHYLQTLNEDFPSDALLTVETENVAEILINVEKDIDRVDEVAAGVLEDLVIYPKKIAEQLVEIASDLEEWAEDLDARVAPNLSIVAKKLKNHRHSSGECPFPSLNNAESKSIFDAVLSGVAHSAVHRAMTEIGSEMRGIAAELRKADKITAGTRPKRIARKIRVSIVAPLKTITGKEAEDYFKDDEKKEMRDDWSFVQEEFAEVVVDSLPMARLHLNNNMFPVDPLSVQKAQSSQNFDFGLAGLKQLSASYAKSEERSDVAESGGGTVVVNGIEGKGKVIGCDYTVHRSDPKTTFSTRSRVQPTVRLNREMLPRSQPKPKDMFTFLCAQDFRRDEFENHARVAHDVADSGLGGWVERRCPLARLGCAFALRPLAPCAETGQLVFDPHLDSFGVQPNRPLLELHEHHSSISLEILPPEVLEVIFRHLDGFSLNNVSRTCKFFRQVCFGLLEDKGMVLPVWKKISKGSDDLASAWRVSHYRWFFSKDASVDKWVLTDDSFKMSQHLEQCEFNERNVASEEKVLVMLKGEVSDLKIKGRYPNAGFFIK